MQFLNANWLKPIHIRLVWTVLIFSGSLYCLFETSVYGGVIMMHGKVPDWFGYSVSSVCGAVALCFFWWITGQAFAQNTLKTTENKWPIVDKKAPQENTGLSIGSESVVMGHVPSNTKVGDRSVVVGATDDKGSTILNTPMAVGHGAKAGPGSIAIGAGSGAGAGGKESPKDVEGRAADLPKPK